MSDHLEPHADVFTRRVGDEVVIVQLERSEIFSLNPTGARLWDLLSQGLSVSEATAYLTEEYEVDALQLRGEVDVLLEQLVGEGLLRPSP